MSAKSFAVRPALRTWAVCSVLFAGSLLLFSRASGYGFSIYDDPIYVTDNPHVQAGLTWAGLSWAFAAPNDYWHPLSWLSHMLDWEVYGDAAGGHHLTSSIWHAVNAVLAFLVLRRLTGAFWISAFSAALFAWHPLRVESVVWITERKDVMSGCFFLLTLWAYAAYAGQRRTGPAWGRYFLTLGLFAVGLMCKPALVSVPLLLLVLDFWPLNRGTVSSTQEWWRLLREKIPFFALSAVISVLTWLMQEQQGAIVLHLPLGARAGNAVVSLTRYLGKFFWPFNLTVCYPHPGYWPVEIVIGSALLGLGLTVLAWRQRNRQPWLLAGWLWFLVMLLPVIGLVQTGFQAMADRYTYLAILGWQLALLGSWRGLLDQPALRWTSAGIGIVVLLACAARTWSQEATWRDSVTLFQHAIAVTPPNDVAEGFLGYTLLGLHRIDEAETHATRALAINPENRTALYTLTGIREQQGRVAEAVAIRRTILQLNPGDATGEYMLGVLLLRQNQTPEAVAHLKSAMQRRPDLLAANLRNATEEILHGDPRNGLAYLSVAGVTDASVYFWTGLAFARMGRVDEALASYTRAVELQPDYAEAHVEIGLILLARQQPAEAALHFRNAAASRPGLWPALFGLGRAEMQLGRAVEAAAALERAATLAPDNPRVFRTWAEALARAGQLAQAVAPYERAVQLEPGDAETHAALGYVLLLSHRHTEAVAQWEEALRLDPNLPGLRERLEKIR